MRSWVQWDTKGVLPEGTEKGRDTRRPKATWLWAFMLSTKAYSHIKACSISHTHSCHLIQTGAPSYSPLPSVIKRYPGGYNFQDLQSHCGVCGAPLTQVILCEIMVGARCWEAKNQRKRMHGVADEWHRKQPKIPQGWLTKQKRVRRPGCLFCLRHSHTFIN